MIAIAIFHLERCTLFDCRMCRFVVEIVILWPSYHHCLLLQGYSVDLLKIQRISGQKVRALNVRMTLKMTAYVDISESRVLSKRRISATQLPSPAKDSK